MRNPLNHVVLYTAHLALYAAPLALCAAPVALLVAACAPREEARGPWTLSGQATLYGRLSHTGIRVITEPDGFETTTNARGNWVLTGVTDLDVTVRYEHAGFAPETRRVWLDGEQAPIALYRGRSVSLPPALEITDAEEIPPAGLLLTGASGERVLVDLQAGLVGLTLAAEWGPTSRVGEFVVGIDALSGGLTPTTPAEPDGFAPGGALSVRGERRGMLLSREHPKEPGEPDGPEMLDVVYWMPGSEAVAFDRPVLTVGPPMRVGDADDEAITLLVDDGWVRWQPGAPAERLSVMSRSAVRTARPLFAPVKSGRAGRSLCYAWGDPAERSVDCVAAGDAARTVARVTSPDGQPVEPTLLAAEPPIVLWREAATSICHAVLGVGDPVAAGEDTRFPCSASMPNARPLGAAVVFQDSAGELHELGPAGHKRLGRGRALTGGRGDVLGFLADDKWPTLLTADGKRLVSPEPCAADTALHLAGDALLAVDATAKRALALRPTGAPIFLPMLSADLRAAAQPAIVSRADDLISLSGAGGFVRLDLGHSEVFSLVHRGWRFLDFSWPRAHPGIDGVAVSVDTEAALPEVALIKLRERVRAVDLYSLATEPLGEATQAGMMNGRAWLVNERGLYIVDDPAAE